MMTGTLSMLASNEYLYEWLFIALRCEMDVIFEAYK